MSVGGIFKSTAMIVLVGVFSMSCTKHNGETEEGLKTSETIRIHIPTEPPSLDWHILTDTTSAFFANNLMDGLMKFDQKDPELKAIPSLAESVDVNKDSTVFTFKIRKGVKWTDGVELTAQHFVDGIERLLNPATAAEYAYFVFAVKNAQEYNQKKAKFEDVGVKALDANTIQFTLKVPMSFFPSLLTHQSTFAIRKDIVAKFGDRWTNPANIVTLGPYKLKTWNHDKDLVLERNETYWGPKPKTKYVLGLIIKEVLTALTLFDSDKLDILFQLPSQDLRELKTKKEYRLNPMLSNYFYELNVKKAPTDNVNYRRALSAAIDRKQIVDLLAGEQIPNTNWVPKGMFGYNENIGIKFDVAKAKEYLKKAGFDETHKPAKLTISFNTDQDHKRVAENIQAQLKKNLGIDVELANKEWKVYLSDMKADPPQMFRMGWVADYPDPDNFFTLMTGVSENNHTLWKNAKFDELTEKASRLGDKDERRKLYDQANKILTEDEVPVISIYSYTSHFFVKDRIKNLIISPMAESELVLSNIELAP
jgi:oligopeptide transport system substrate-binding protein